MLFDDIVGGMVAAMAMMLACLTIIFAQTVRSAGLNCSCCCPCTMSSQPIMQDPQTCSRLNMTLVWSA